MKFDRYIARFQELIKEAGKARRYKAAMSTDYMEMADLIPLRSRGLALLADTFGEGHSYYKGFHEHTAPDCKAQDFDGAIGILKAAEHDLREGWFVTLKQLVAAEFFTDFMEMAEHLLSNKFHDAAAVVIGSVLEEHLRQLCRTHNVDVEIHKLDGSIIPKRADAMNADLVKAGAYLSIDGKQVTAWLALRNSAAHGKYQEYTREQIALMYQGVLSFLSRITQ